MRTGYCSHSLLGLAKISAAAFTVLVANLSLFAQPAPNVPAGDVCAPQGVSCDGVDWFVAPNGTANTASGGIFTDPWDLATAFSGAAGKIKPGDKVWLRGGSYLAAGDSSFEVNVSGTAARPVVIRGYPGERAAIDGRNAARNTVYLNGSYVWLWGIEVTNTNPNTPKYGIGYGNHGLSSGPVKSSGLRIINVVTHDHYNSGIGMYGEASDAEVYGTLSYNNGRSDSPDHGYGVSAQNAAGYKLFEDTLFFNNFGDYQVQASGQAGTLLNLQFKNDIVFGGGSGSGRWGVLAGGPEGDVRNFVFENGFVYVAGFELGDMLGQPAHDSSVKDNYFIGNFNDAADRMIYFHPGNTGTVFTGNTIYDKQRSFAGSAYPNNTYYDSRPGGISIAVRPNRYERGRGNIVVVNWDNSPSAAVDISALGLASGQKFQIVDAQDFFGAPVFTGTYNGAAVTLPLTGTSVSAPVAIPPGFSSWPHTPGEFGVFVVLPDSSSSTPAPAARTLKVMPLGDSIVYGQTDTAGAWRSRLWDLAHAAGYTFEYVGSQTHGDFSDPPSAANEGHNEYGYADLTPGVAGWLATYDPDIILISDAPDLDQPASRTLNELGVLLDTITAAKPNAYILVSDLIRTNNAALQPAVLEINRNMPSILSPRIAAGKRIIAVTGMNDALTAGDLVDHFHPAQSGYDKMAAVWWPVLRQLLDAVGASPAAARPPR